MANAKSTINTFARAGARRVLPLVPIPIKRQVLYWRKFKKPIPTTPLTYLDKIQWRILHDRRPLIAQGGDKLAMKAHAEGSNKEVLVPRTIWQGRSLESIYSTDWGCDWVLKPVTGSGYLAFGSGSLKDSKVSLDAVKRWRHEDQYRIQGEWAYGQAAPGYFLEEKIETLDGQPPNDFKFFVFGGEVKLVLFGTPRFNGAQARFYTPDWSPLDVRQGGFDLAPVIAPPVHLSEMISIANDIGAAYDFIRVDLYDTVGGVYFGEITPYPTGGMSRFDDPEFDLWLGSQWELPSLG